MSRFSFSKDHKLRTTGEFQRVYRHGRRIRGEGYVLILLPNAGGSERLGISVHRKTGNAVRRNRIKRLIREVFRLNRYLFPSSCEIVFTVRPEFTMNRLGDIKASLTCLLKDREQVA